MRFWPVNEILFLTFQRLNSGMNLPTCEDQSWFKVQAVFRLDWCKMFSRIPGGTRTRGWRPLQCWSFLYTADTVSFWIPALTPGVSYDFLHVLCFLCTIVFSSHIGGLHFESRLMIKFCHNVIIYIKYVTSGSSHSPPDSSFITVILLDASKLHFVIYFMHRSLLKKHGINQRPVVG
jgi:hypothetical protein